jgi:predicted nucleic acid-binding protein
VIVVDASALVDFLAPTVVDAALDDRLLADASLHAPHLVDVEVVNALRRLSLRSTLGPDRAADAMLDLDDLPITRYPHGALLPRAWELRHTLPIQDGVYVSLAEALDAPLVTCDARLAGAPGIRASIEVYSRGA